MTGSPPSVRRSRPRTLASSSKRTRETSAFEPSMTVTSPGARSGSRCHVRCAARSPSAARPPWSAADRPVTTPLLPRAARRVGR